MRPGEGGKPAVQTRIGGAETDPCFGQLDRVFPPTGIDVDLSEHDMGGGVARVQPDRLLERRDPAIDAMRPHADQTEGVMGVWIARVETDRALAQLVSPGEVGFGTLRPTEKA